MAVVSLTTDFGLRDPFVGIMKGVVLTRAPGTAIVDVTHGIAPQDVTAGALVLRHAAPYFPDGTIHVAVVDPGVGGPRRPLVVETAWATFVGPDNGVLSLAAPADAVRRIVHLTDDRFFLSPRSATFHGRDVFAPVAAALAAGTDPGALGTPVSDMTRIAVPEPTCEARTIVGRVIYVDHFGNLVTNVAEAALTGVAREALVIRAGATTIRGLAPSYGAVARGTPLGIVGSWGLLELAVRDGSAEATLGLGRDAEVRIDVP
jgi:S-adenosylmethionine hydrolase